MKSIDDIIDKTSVFKIIKKHPQHSKNKECGIAYERYDKIKTYLENSDDNYGLECLENTLVSANDYIISFTKMDNLSLVDKFRSDKELFVEKLKELNDRRKKRHNALITNLGILNKYLFKEYGFDEIPLGGLFSLDPTRYYDRDAVGDWAMFLMIGLYNN